MGRKVLKQYLGVEAALSILGIVTRVATGVAISVMFSLVMFPVMMIILGLLGIFALPFAIAPVNLLIGGYLARSSRILGYTIIVTGLVISVYVALAILNWVPWL